MEYCVYLLKSKKDNKYYIGSSNNIYRRLKEHNNGEEKSTKFRIPFDLIGYKVYDNLSEARWNEHLIKKSASKRNKFIKEIIGV